MKNAKIKINNLSRIDYWKIRFVDMDDSYGECSEPRKLIQIQQGMSKRDTVETVLHEVAHAFFPGLSEAAVEELGRAMRDALFETKVVDV